MRRPGSALLAASAGVVLAAGLTTGTLADELLVLHSTVPGLDPGQVATTGEPIEVPRDTDLTLIAPSGGVLQIEGPWQGQIEAPPVAEGGGLIGQLVGLFQAPAPEARLGAMRSFSNCELVELGRTQDVCIPESGCVEIRTSGDVPRSLMAEGPDGSRVELERGMGGEIWAWPRGHLLSEGTYAVSPDGGIAETLTIHHQPPLESKAHEIAWMGQAGCVGQAKTALDELGR